jgi:hypothetical protein
MDQIAGQISIRFISSKNTEMNTKPEVLDPGDVPVRRTNKFLITPDTDTNSTALIYGTGIPYQFWISHRTKKSEYNYGGPDYHFLYMVIS